MKKVLLHFICLVMIVSNIFCINSYATEEEVNNQNVEQQVSDNLEQVQNFEEQCQAEVKVVGEIKDSEENSNIKIQEVTLKILNGTYKGKEVTGNYVISNKDAVEKVKLKVGDEVYVIISGDVQGNLFVTIQNLHRNVYIILLVVGLLIAILFLYEKHAIKPLLSCLITILLVYFMLFKQISAGHNVIFVSVLFGLILSIVEAIINNGLNKKVWISIIGIFSGVLGSIIFSIIFMNLTRINLNNDSQINSNINKNSLMLAGTIIATFGSCINISMHIIQNLDKKKIETKDFFKKDLFKLGLIFGGQQAMKFVNTLLLVFVGISFELIIVNSENYNSLLGSLSQDYSLASIILIISSCIGIILSVPITSFIYSLINSKKTIYKTISENKVDGKRSLKI